MAALTARTLAVAALACLAALLLQAGLARADEPGGDAIEVTAPGGALVVTISSPGGQPTWAARLRGEEIIAPSRLGLRFASGPDLDAGLEIAAVERASADTRWEQPWGERRIVRDRHEEVAVTFADAGDPARGFVLRVRVFDEGLGFRYEAADTGARAIVDEITEFRVAADATAWWTPAGEFNRLEYTYRTTPVAEIPRANTPLTLRTAGGTHLAIHEAALVGYAGMWLDQRRAGVLEAELAPRHDGVKVRVDGAFVTPWRVVQVADSAAALYNGSDIYLNLNEPNALGDVSYFEPGKYIGIWWGMHIGKYTWGSGPDHGATTDNTKRYIDFAAEHGFSGVLVEGWNIGWDGDWFNNGDLFRFAEAYPDYDLPALAAYAADKGVRLIGHHETSGNITNYEAQLDEALDLMAAHGVRVIKTGYVADASDLKLVDADGHARYTWHDSQERVEHDIRVLEAAHERGIAINAHEPARATGLRRTYPNAVSREGARGMEFNAWGTPPNTVEHQAILPYTRMLAGPFDFTPGIFDLRPNGEDDVNRVPSTLAKQLALYVTIYSPVQMAADLPENYARNWEAFQFIRDVPADWEHSIALQGEVGDHFVIARQDRNSPDWYLGGVTDEIARTVTVPLDFLEAGRAYTAEIYRDGPDADWDTNPYPVTIERRAVSSGDTLTLPMAPGGGFAVRLAAGETAAAREARADPLVIRTRTLPSGARLSSIDPLPTDTVTPRQVQVWTPPGYEESDARYPVLYMQDGQNLFERGHSYSGDSWEVDETVSRLIEAGEIPPVIVVGLSSTETRWQDYAPSSFVDALDAEARASLVARAGGAPTSDAYLRYLVGEVKPFIDRRYRTRPGREDTYVAGASMGGLISLYAVSQYPDVFAGAAAISTHWPLHDPDAADPEATIDAIKAGLEAGGLDPARHRLWFDLGTENLDAHYPPYQAAIDAYLETRGFEGRAIETRLYDGADHNEASWAARLEDPLVFLFGAPADRDDTR